MNLFPRVVSVVSAGLVPWAFAASSPPLSPMSQRQVLSDGSVLALSRVQVGSHIRTAHGTLLEKFFRNVGPPDKCWLDAQFSLTGPHASRNALVRGIGPVRPGSSRFRLAIRGEGGVEFVQYEWGGFQAYPEGYRADVVTGCFSRTSPWLEFCFERRDTQGGTWRVVADLKVKNPARPVIRPWAAQSAPIIKAARGMSFVLGQITVETNDILNQIVTVPLTVRSNGGPWANRTAVHVRGEDASGNWLDPLEERLPGPMGVIVQGQNVIDNWGGVLVSRKNLDPAYVWKLDADFEPESGFPPGAMLSITLPKNVSTISTNLMHVPVSVSWNKVWLHASMATNDPNLALQFIDAEGELRWYSAAAGRSQYGFRLYYGDTMREFRNGVPVINDFEPTNLTFAVVPHVPVTFYARPRQVNRRTQN